MRTFSCSFRKNLKEHEKVPKKLIFAFFPLNPFNPLQHQRAALYVRMAQQHPRGWPSVPFTLSIADAYFFEELSAALGYKQATHWLAHHCKQRSGANSSAGSATPCSHEAAGSAMCSLLPTERNSWKTGHAEMSGLALELGADRGLLYTDAAHRVLDVSPRSSRKAVDTEAGGAKQTLSSGFRNQDVSGHHHPGRESRPREEVNAAASSAPTSPPQPQRAAR